jgi:hypothetical protein
MSAEREDMVRRIYALEQRLASGNSAAAHLAEIDVPVPQDTARRIGQLIKEGKERVRSEELAKAGRSEEVIESDRTGRRISRFRGASCWDAFKQIPRLVTSVRIPK